MVIKSFNIQEQVYNKFSKFCKEHGISMSKQVELFMESQISDKEEIKPDYLKKLNKISKQKHYKFNTISELRNILEHD